MQHLRRSGTAEALDDAVRGRGVPILGLCLGMQLLADGQRGGHVQPGLGLDPRPGASAARPWSTASSGRCRTWAGTRCRRSGRARSPHWPPRRAALLLRALLRLRSPTTRPTSSAPRDYGAPFTSAVEQRQRHRRAVPPREEPPPRHGPPRRLAGRSDVQLEPRVIPCLLLDGGTLVKTRQFGERDVRRRSRQRAQHLQRLRGRRDRPARHLGGTDPPSDADAGPRAPGRGVLHPARLRRWAHDRRRTWRAVLRVGVEKVVLNSRARR